VIATVVAWDGRVTHHTGGDCTGRNYELPIPQRPLLALEITKGNSYLVSLLVQIGYSLPAARGFVPHQKAAPALHNHSIDDQFGDGSFFDLGGILVNGAVSFENRSEKDVPGMVHNGLPRTEDDVVRAGAFNQIIASCLVAAFL